MTATAKSIRVLLADDHPVVRGGLCALLGTLPGMEVVGEVGNGLDAVAQARQTRPDVVIMDLRMPGLGGVEATRQITTADDDVAVLVLTMFDEDALIAEALAAGARGYVLKGAEGAEIERAIRAVADGQAIFGRTVAGRVLRHSTAQRVDPAPPQLTPQERRVTELLAGGLANGAIAARLVITPKTVANHVSAIFGKLGVATRAEAIVIARNAGFGLGDGPHR